MTGRCWSKGTSLRGAFAPKQSRLSDWSISGLLRFARNDEAAIAPLRLIRDHLVVDLGNGVDAAQAPGRQKFVLDDVDGLGDAGLATGAEAIGVGAAEHAGFCAER